MKNKSKYIKFIPPPITAMIVIAMLFVFAILGFMNIRQNLLNEDKTTKPDIIISSHHMLVKIKLDTVHFWVDSLYLRWTLDHEPVVGDKISINFKDKVFSINRFANDETVMSGTITEVLKAHLATGTQLQPCGCE